QRHYLARVAAGVGIAQPQPVLDRPLGAHGADREAVAILETPPQRQRLGKEHAGVEGEHVDRQAVPAYEVEDHAPLDAKARGAREARKAPPRRNEPEQCVAHAASRRRATKKKFHRSARSIPTAVSGITTPSAPGSRRDRPNATTQASKLMHTRRNVSALSRRISQWPSGMPTSTAGTIHGRRPKLSPVNSPSEA